MILPTQRRSPSWRIALWGGAAAVLLLPLAAMQFTREVNWGLGDFVVFGAMLAAACAGFEAVMRFAPAPRRWWTGAAIVAVFLLVWVELAVGIFH